MTTPYSNVEPVQYPLSTSAPGPCWMAGAGTVTVVNQDTANIAYVGYTNAVSAGNASAIPIQPRSSFTFTGQQALYAVGAVANMQPLLLVPGTAYAPGTVIIDGPVDITGPVQVEGSVSVSGTVNVGTVGSIVETTITNTPNVSVTNTVATTVSNNVSVQNAAGGSLTVAGTIDIGNTPSVTISGTPNVTIASGTVDATITGTTDVNVQNATIDVVGAGGYVLPGQVQQITQLTATVSPGLFNTTSLFDVTSYQSLDFNVAASSSGGAVTGAAYSSLIVCSFWDTTGTYLLGQQVITVPLGLTTAVSVPVQGAMVSFTMQNLGTVSNITYSTTVWGSYRAITKLTWGITSYLGAPASDATLNWEYYNPPTGTTDLSTAGWISSGTYQPVSTTIPTAILFPPTSGLVTGYYQVSGSTAFSNDPVVIDMMGQKRGSIVAGTNNEGVLMNIPLSTASSPTFFNQVFPSSWTALVINGSSTSTCKLQFTGVEQQ